MIHQNDIDGIAAVMTFVDDQNATHKHSEQSRDMNPTVRRKILFLVTEDWFFLSHFQPFVREAIDLGFEPIVATRVRKGFDELRQLGCQVIPLEAERSSLNPFGLASNLNNLIRVLRSERPSVVHCISLRLVVLGGLAARFVGLRNVVLAPVGLGQLWISNRLQDRLSRRLIRGLVGRSLRKAGTRYLFENDHDPTEFSLHPTDADVTVIGGAGVDPSQFSRAPEPAQSPIKIAVVARMVHAKGIIQSIEAVRRARDRGADVHLSLYGDIDTSNRTALTAESLQSLCLDAGATWHGHVTDVASIWRHHHIAMLLSQREGLPRSLIEAAACGRPIIATDVTGCRTVVRNGVEGLLVPLGDINATADAIAQLSANSTLRAQYGAAAHKRFMENFTEKAVRNTIRAVYLGYLKD